MNSSSAQELLNVKRSFKNWSCLEDEAAQERKKKAVVKIFPCPHKDFSFQGHANVFSFFPSLWTVLDGCIIGDTQRNSLQILI